MGKVTALRCYRCGVEVLVTVEVVVLLSLFGYHSFQFNFDIQIYNKIYEILMEHYVIPN